MRLTSNVSNLSFSCWLSRQHLCQKELQYFHFYSQDRRRQDLSKPPNQIRHRHLVQFLPARLKMFFRLTAILLTHVRLDTPVIYKVWWVFLGELIKIWIFQMFDSGRWLPGGIWKYGRIQSRIPGCPGLHVRHWTYGLVIILLNNQWLFSHIIKKKIVWLSSFFIKQQECQRQEPRNCQNGWHGHP